jgi:hypothetical protein
MSTRMNRRAILAGAATATIALPAIGAPVIGPDPIFAAIEAYKVADAAWFARYRYEDDLAGKGIKLTPAPDDSRTPEMVALVNASIAARIALAETAPTSMAGLLAVLRFVREQSEDDFLFDGGEESARFDASLEQAVLAMTAS